MDGTTTSMLLPISLQVLILKKDGKTNLKVVVYLCKEHAQAVGTPKIPLNDDVLICQVPTCFKLATWKSFLEVSEKRTTGQETPS